MKLYLAAVPILILILIGAVVTVLVSKRPLPEGFSYSSHNNTDWLDASQLRDLAGDPS